ncbi:MAG: CorA family divalent cation transporter [Nocardioides sp.]
MNFAHMPELGWHWGYPYSLLLMLVLMIALWIVFKRSGWL